MRDQAVTRIESVTPSDTVDLTYPGIGIYVGVSGDVKVTTTDGYTETMVGLAAGMWHPIQCRRIWSTGTAATSILTGW